MFEYDIEHILLVHLLFFQRPRVLVETHQNDKLSADASLSPMPSTYFCFQFLGCVLETYYVCAFVKVFYCYHAFTVVISKVVLSSSCDRVNPSSISSAAVCTVFQRMFIGCLLHVLSCCMHYFSVYKLLHAQV